MSVFRFQWQHASSEHGLRRLLARIMIGFEALGIALLVLALLIVPLAMVIALPLVRGLLYRFS